MTRNEDREQVVDWLTQIYMHPEDYQQWYSASEEEWLAEKALELIQLQETGGENASATEI